MAEMSNKELVYEVVKQYTDEICVNMVNRADELMADPITKYMFENTYKYRKREQEQRKRDILNGWNHLQPAIESPQSYQDVIYDMFIKGM